MVPYISNRPLKGTSRLAGYRARRLGALGTSDTINLVGNAGLKVGSSVVGAAAGTAIGAAAGGAIAGSIVPVIGTIIGAVVGILTSKLFGHANYAAVYANIDNVRTLFNAYAAVAGQYPGRMYGWPELQYVWHGAMVSGLFPGNGPPAGQQCTQAMIANKINACGTGQWIDDLLGSSKPTSPGTDNIAEIIAAGLSQGIVDPITMTQRMLVPGMETIAARKNNGWISVSRSTNPALYTQLLMDTADFFMSEVNPNMPVYYGPLGVAPTQQIAPVPTSAAPSAPNIPSAPAQQAPSSQSAVSQVQYSPAMTIHPGDGQVINTIYGVVSFPNQPDTTNNYPVGIVNGQILPGAAGIALQWDGGANLILSNSNGAQWRWVNGQWVQLQAASAPNQQPAVISPSASPQGTDAATAAYIAQLQAQGASQAAALAAATAALQNQGLTAAAAQTQVASAAPYASIPPDVTAAATPLANTAGLSGNSTLLIGGALAVLAVIFATGRPAKGRRR